MFKLWAAVLVLAVVWVTVVCSVMPYKTPAGTVYEMPAVCNGDLYEKTVETRVYTMPASTLEAWNKFLNIAPEGWRLYGTTVSLPGFPMFIVIDESLDAVEYADTLHHERCHIVAGAWHG